MLCEGVDDVCKLGSAGQVGLGRASLQPTCTPGCACPGGSQMRTFPAPISQPAFSGDSCLGRGLLGSPLHVRTHFSQLPPFPGEPVFQDAALSVGCEGCHC